MVCFRANGLSPPSFPPSLIVIIWLKSGLNASRSAPLLPAHLMRLAGDTNVSQIDDASPIHSQTPLRHNNPALSSATSKQLPLPPQAPPQHAARGGAGYPPPQALDGHQGPEGLYADGLRIVYAQVVPTAPPATAAVVEGEKKHLLVLDMEGHFARSMVYLLYEPPVTSQVRWSCLYCTLIFYYCKKISHIDSKCSAIRDKADLSGLVS